MTEYSEFVRETLVRLVLSGSIGVCIVGVLVSVVLENRDVVRPALGGRRSAGKLHVLKLLLEFDDAPLVPVDCLIVG